MVDSKIEPQPGEGGGIKTINQKGPGLQKEDPGETIPDRDPGFESRDLRNLQVLPRTWLDMLGGVAHGVVESTRRFVVEYAREWQPTDERSAARLSEALGRLSASINSHDVTLLEKPGGRCSLLKGTAPRWPFLPAPTWDESPATRTRRIPRGAAGQGRSCRSFHRSSAMRRLLLPLRPLPVLQHGERAAAARAAGARLLAPRERPAPRRA